MKFSIKKTDIRSILGKVQGICSRKTNLAITENVLIDATGGGLRISATDLETGFEGHYQTEIESEGMIAINAKKFLEIVREFPTDTIYVTEIENRWIEIGTEKVEFHIMGMDPEAFPGVPQISDISLFEMNSAALRRMIERTVVITSPSEDKRTHLLGVFFESVSNNDQKSLKMVSTDGNRLSVVDYPYEGEIELESGILIPKKGLQEVLKFLDSDGTVQIGAKESHFVVKKGGETLCIRLLEGDFPRYADILEQIVSGENHQILLNRQTFLMMVKRMSILSSESYKGVIFNIENNCLVVRTTNPELGESREDVGIEYDAEPIEMAFNPRFIMETLNAIEDETVRMTIFSASKPCHLKGENDNTYISVIMPMKI
jgi:DNA polymerase-3 subunit beta